MKYKKNPVCIRIEATDYPLKCDSKSMIFWKNDIVNLKVLILSFIIGLTNYFKKYVRI